MLLVADAPIVTLPLPSVVTCRSAPVLKVMDLPSTVKDEPFAVVEASEFVFVAATSAVAAVIATGVLRLLFDRGAGDRVVGAGSPSRSFAVAPEMAAEVKFDLVE